MCVKCLEAASEFIVTPSELASDDVNILVTASERNRLNEALEIQWSDGFRILATLLRSNSYIYKLVVREVELLRYKRLSYAIAMIELQADVELKDTIMVAMPKLVYVKKNLKNPRQAARGVHVSMKVAFKPLKQVYRLGSNRNNASSIGIKKQDMVASKDVSHSNPFGVLNSIEKDDDMVSGVSVWEGDEDFSRNIVTNSHVTPSWREIVSLTFSEAGVLHVN
nr:hypothetical protein [Tanacetum cinerariifolium]